MKAGESGANLSSRENGEGEAGFIPLSLRREHKTPLWHFLSLFKNPSLFLSDVWKKEVYQQALELKRYQGRYLMQPIILRDASVSGHNPGTVR